MATNAIYIGRRFNGGKISYDFKLPDESIIVFSGLRGLILGGTYTYNDEKKTISAKPERLDFPIVENIEWEKKDAAAEGKIKLARAEYAIKKKHSPIYKKSNRGDSSSCKRGELLRQARPNRVPYCIDRGSKMSGDFIHQSMFGCAGCEAVRSAVNAAGYCSKCASPEGETVTPPGVSIMDAAKLMRKTLTDEIDGLGLPSLSVLTALAILSVSIRREETMRGDQ